MTGVRVIKKGFTVLEMVIVMGIFSIASMYSMSAYVKSNSGQKKIAGISRSTADARFALETMVREVRTGMIDYAMYQTANIPINNNPNHDLIIRDSSNNLVWFTYVQTGNKHEIKVCFTDAACENGEWNVVTPGNIDITSFDVYLWPKVDPFLWNETSSDYDANQQPMATIIIRSKSLDVADTLAQETHLQTTITSRAYVR